MLDGHDEASLGFRANDLAYDPRHMHNAALGSSPEYRKAALMQFHQQQQHQQQQYGLYSPNGGLSEPLGSPTGLDYPGSGLRGAELNLSDARAVAAARATHAAAEKKLRLQSQQIMMQQQQLLMMRQQQQQQQHQNQQQPLQQLQQQQQLQNHHPQSQKHGHPKQGRSKHSNSHQGSRSQVSSPKHQHASQHKIGHDTKSGYDSDHQGSVRNGGAHRSQQQQQQLDEARDAENDAGHGVRSPLLEEFRNNKNNKKYELQVSLLFSFLINNSFLSFAFRVLITIDTPCMLWINRTSREAWWNSVAINMAHVSSNKNSRQRVRRKRLWSLTKFCLRHCSL